jgi:DNA-binding IclR family transcriptional regulator
MEKQESIVDNAVDKDPRDYNQVQVINRAVRIMRAIKDSGGLNLSHLAKEVGLARSTVYRIVSTLEANGLLTTETVDGRIQLGMELVSLGSAVKNDIRIILRPYLELLSIEVNETVDLGILDNDRLIYLDQVSRDQRLRAASIVGVTFPLHCTANGKALLSVLPPEDVLRILPEKLQIFTPNTIQTRDQLMKELEVVREEGVAYDCDEHTLGICAVGAAIEGLMRPQAAISIPVPSVRFHDNKEILSSALIRTCEDINLRLRTPNF